MRRIVLIAMRREEQVLPTGNEQPNIEREDDAICWSLMGDRWYRHDRRIEVRDLLIAHQREVVIRKDGIKVSPGAVAVAQCFGKLRQRPVADAGILVRGNVGRIEYAEWGLQRLAASQDSRVLVAVRVAGVTSAKTDQVGAAGG